MSRKGLHLSSYMRLEAKFIANSSCLSDEYDITSGPFIIGVTKALPVRSHAHTHTQSHMHTDTQNFSALKIKLQFFCLLALYSKNCIKLLRIYSNN